MCLSVSVLVVDGNILKYRDCEKEVGKEELWNEPERPLAGDRPECLCFCAEIRSDNAAREMS